MRVSILVPVFNCEKYLAECLQSILEQDYGDFELLIGDNASTDGTADIIDFYARQDARIAWWRNSENIGGFDNFKLCVKRAQGDYIKFMCADDKFLGPSALGKMVSLLSENSGISLVSSASLVINSRSETIKARKPWRGNQIIKGQKAIITCFERNENIVGEPSGALFRRSQSKQWAQGRCPHLMDLEQWFALLEVGDWGYLAEPLFAFRQHPDQGTNINRQTGLGRTDPLLLFTEYWHRPWMRETATQRMLFVQACFLKREYGREAETIVLELKKAITLINYGYYWLERKAKRPFKEIKKLSVKGARFFLG